MRVNGNHSGVDRRTFLKSTAGVAGVGAFAGCTGGSGGSSSSGGSGEKPGADGEMVMTTSTETTAAYAMSQAIANAVNQNTDKIRVGARPSEGTNANIGRLARQESDIAYIQNWTANKIAEGKGSFADLSYTPYQVFHLYDLAWFLASGNDGWTSVTDISKDSRVSPTPRGSGTAEMLEHSLDYAVGDYERISIKYGSQASAMSSGRLDVGAATYVNLSVEPGWLQQMKGTVDLRVLGWPDDAVAKLEEDPAIILSDIDMSQFDGYGYTPETLTTPTLAYNFVVRDDFSYDTLYTFLETLWAQREGLQEDNALLGKLADGEFWTTNAYEGLPFHPAAADFYKEKGVWSDDLERGKE
ncbi:TAXI family TRAP transporter solute-binding subunit [Halospeciosus flavus]|uniref:TAXI family TRAP transporter solute-binding subunit n=1 Tax=Halospeciosus flavus TaxID=3032283 RepID=A0ABD5Z6U0_9EURY|nr:TAXI family TRAP transporter solute-binding subunit [Halospeciosus flavus]